MMVMMMARMGDGGGQGQDPKDMGELCREDEATLFAVSLV